MATATASSYSVITLGEAAEKAAARGFGLGGPPAPEDGRRGRVHVRRDFDINSFGVNAFYQAHSGAVVVGEHEETAPSRAATRSCTSWSTAPPPSPSPARRPRRHAAPPSSSVP